MIVPGTPIVNSWISFILPVLVMILLFVLLFIFEIKSYSKDKEGIAFFWFIGAFTVVLLLAASISTEFSGNLLKDTPFVHDTLKEESFHTSLKNSYSNVSSIPERTEFTNGYGKINPTTTLLMVEGKPEACYVLQVGEPKNRKYKFDLYCGKNAVKINPTVEAVL